MKTIKTMCAYLIEFTRMIWLTLKNPQGGFIAGLFFVAMSVMITVSAALWGAQTIAWTLGAASAVSAFLLAQGTPTAFRLVQKRVRRRRLRRMLDGMAPTSKSVDAAVARLRERLGTVNDQAKRDQIISEEADRFAQEITRCLSKGREGVGVEKGS